MKSDLEREFSTRTINGVNRRKLSEIVQQMRSTYCRYIGVQFMHIDDLSVRAWLQNRMEGTENHLRISRDELIDRIGKTSLKHEPGTKEQYSNLGYQLLAAIYGDGA